MTVPPRGRKSLRPLTRGYTPLRARRGGRAGPFSRCLEDNTTAISAARAGYSPALRHLPRTERISVGVLYEILVEREDCTLQYQPSAEHKGDMFTKRLDPVTFEAAIKRANLRKMDPQRQQQA